MFKQITSAVLLILFTILFSVSSFSHSGRTDANGGHKDNKNKSGLGYYHYHCGGYPAHLHKNGICPYTSSNNVTKPAVDEKANNVYLNSVKYTMTVGETFTPTVISNSSEATKYTSSNTNVATINYNTGLITAIAPGNTTIKAYNSKKSASYILTITKPKEYILYSNIKAKISNYEIPSYNYNGKTYVKCSDLNNYGFDVTFSQQTSTILIKRNSTKKITPIVLNSNTHGAKAYELLSTSLKVYDDKSITLTSINGDGNMFVAFSDLSSFGEVKWNPQERVTTLNLK